MTFEKLLLRIETNILELKINFINNYKYRRDRGTMDLFKSSQKKKFSCQCHILMSLIYLPSFRANTKHLGHNGRQIFFQKIFNKIKKVTL